MPELLSQIRGVFLLLLTMIYGYIIHKKYVEEISNFLQSAYGSYDSRNQVSKN